MTSTGRVDLGPNEAEPTGEHYGLEKRVTKGGGGDGFADVWKRGFFAWEYKGKRHDLHGASLEPRHRHRLGASQRMRIVRDHITLSELAELAEERFGDLVKGVVDVEREVMAVGAELHADEERDLLLDGSEQAALWGINLYPADYGAPGWLEYDSMINLRPRLGNRTRSVEDSVLRQRIAAIVDELVQS